uniref:Uncharacterized protein n=1 Tax=Kwoniella bestiolae CBS 10118 TaxID=1296100 RepID=A0A1B9GGN1_9TREE|nr:hypothetical protein I302_01741 [Kwoniella bestiolae CBS 10118]OCF30222.1 hypothetical protein I302_01741 [Kwoniella bestiolae CBS 10118]
MPRASSSTSTSKRRSSRLATQSQSQSQSQSQPDNSPSWLLDSQSQSHFQTQTQSQPDHSFLSISTASLPPKYSINLALPSDVELSNTEEREYQVRGEEFLHDAWRRSDEKEGKLVDLRERSKRVIRINGEKPTYTGKGKAKETSEDVLWYNAGMKFPCVCSLIRYTCSYTLCIKPPLSSHLSHPYLLEDSFVAQDVNDLPPWYIDTDLIDLDPSMDDIPEFEVSWNTPPAEQHQSSQLSNPETVYEPSPVNLDLQKAQSRLRKGKFRAGNTGLDISLPLAEFQAGNGTSSGKAVWEEESKRRKAHRRGIIRGDSGYGRMWDFLPLPSTHPSRYLPPPVKRVRTKIPPYNLPRAYHSVPHPFHPNLPEYITTNSSRRVYWLIPIHGPVLIPTLNHPMTKNIYDGQAMPSRGELRDIDIDLDGESGRGAGREVKRKDKVISWTPSLLLSFIRQFLHPLYMNDQRPFGELSYAFSGPKPDPFLDISQSRITSSTDITKKMQPDKEETVKPECGDHLRIYCNAKYSLELRTWLHNVKIPIPLKKSHDADAEGEGDKSANGGDIKQNGKGEESVRIFYKNRLTLVGDRGEVLVVA